MSHHKDTRGQRTFSKPLAQAPFEGTAQAADDPDLGPSRTESHREAKRIESVGKLLISMSAPEFDNAPLPEHVRDAVLAARKLTRGALKRQALYLGKLLRDLNEEFDEIDAYVRGEGERKREEAFAFQQAERWRDRLIAGGDDAIGTFLARYPGADRPRLRQLTRTAAKEAAHQKPPTASRKIFRYLREVMEDAQALEATDEDE